MKYIPYLNTPKQQLEKAKKKHKKAHHRINNIAMCKYYLSKPKRMKRYLEVLGYEEWF